MAQYQGRIAKLADKDNNTVVPITNARAVEVSKNRNLEAIVDKVDDMENVAQRVFNNSITPIITPIQTSVQRLDGIEAKANANTTKVNQLEQKQTSDKNEVTNTLNGVKQSVQTIEGNVTNTSNTVTQHTQQIADLEYSVGEALPKAEEAVAKVDGILGEKYIDCIAQGKMTQVGKQADGQVVANDNSFAKSAMLKGQTLINIAPINYNLGGIKLSDEVTIKASATTSSSSEFRVKAFQLIYNLKPNTKYAICVKVTEIKNVSVLASYLKFADDTFKYNVFNDLTKVGNYIIPFTTENKEVKEIAFYLHQNVDTSIYAKIKEVMLFEYQDGMENWDIPYFEGMASVKNPVVTSVGKNLFKYDIKKQIFGNLGSSAAYKTSSETMQLKPNTTYTISVLKKNNDNVRVICAGDGTEWLSVTQTRNIISRTDSSSYPVNAINKLTFTTSNTGLINLWYYDESKRYMLSDWLEEIQLEESPTSTTYEPYKSHTVSSTEEIILRSLPNGTCDTLNLVTGEYVQRIGEKKLTENDAWTQGKAIFTSSNSVFYTPLEGKATDLTSKSILDTLGFSNNIGSSVNYQPFNDKRCIAISQDGNIYFSIPKKELTSDNIEGWKAFLTKNGGINLVYELAIPIVKKVKLSNSPFMFKDGHIILSSANDLLPSLTYTTTVGIKGQVETLNQVVRKIATDRQNIHDNQSLPVEKGVWTPRFEGVLGGVCSSYDIQEGIYCRIDKLVHIQLKLSVNDYKVCQGVFCVRGLPFTPGNAHTALSIGVINNLKTTLDNASVNAYIDASTDKIILGFNEIRDGSMHYQFENPQVANPAKPILLIIAGTYMIN